MLSVANDDMSYASPAVDGDTNLPSRFEGKFREGVRETDRDTILFSASTFIKFGEPIAMNRFKPL